MRAPLGAILAGGQNRRYGGHKALAAVAGEPIVERVRRALGAVLPELVLIANEPAIYAGVGLPMRADLRPGAGVLGGILTALHWARELGRPGVVAVACDMPFLSPPLLRLLVEEAACAPMADVVAPASGNRRGVEPLCAFYGTGCIGPIEAELARGERHIVGFFDDVVVRTIPADAVRAFGDPEMLFLNVNTPEERERAERMAKEVGA
ncbi:MAG: molybdenum cofactor guanylyltransferase [Gemmatimonadetes bacterium]|nr:molybdenum cofactor guanylyltransferase [Gemmatimonadota bacterium]